LRSTFVYPGIYHSIWESHNFHRFLSSWSLCETRKYMSTYTWGVVTL